MIRLRLPLLVSLIIAPALGQLQTLDGDLIAQIRVNRLPGVTAVVFSKDDVLATGAAGMREIGKPGTITVNDRFHIGSNAKAMLATVIGMLVEEGKLSWASRPIEVLQVHEANPSYIQVTLTMLLNHQAGLPAFEDETSPEWHAWVANRRKAGSAGEPVRRFSEWVLMQPPAVPRATKFLYSNAGYSVVAAMAEQVTGASWKDLVRNRLFKPLRMDADVGWPAAIDQNQPQGHYETKSGLKVQDPTEPVPPFIQPAGNVQVHILEYVKFLQLHLRGLAGIDGLLKSATIRLMHTPTDKMEF